MKFTRYQIFVIAVLTFIQFTVMVDFMILSPLGAILLEELDITTAQFGLVFSAYAFSAGISGLLFAGFADKFDRKKLLLFFYGGFILGTVLCGVAPSYGLLLAARIVTGIFGGVLSSIAMAIVTDIFPFEMRGRVMGLMMTAFAASQVAGIPAGTTLSVLWGWHAPFLMIAAIGAAVGVVIAIYLKPVDAHLKLKNDRNPFQHLLKAVSTRSYQRAFAAILLLATGGFMMMPFGAAFMVNNLGIPVERLNLVYLVTGISAIVAGPLAGRLADRIGKYPLFVAGSILAMATVTYYCHMGVTPLWGVILVNAVLFAGITARVASASALTSAVPEMQDRGAYMSISGSLQQLSGGLASALAGVIVVQEAGGRLGRYDILGWVVVGAMVTTIALMYSIHRIVAEKQKAPTTGPGAPQGAAPSTAAKTSS